MQEQQEQREQQEQEQQELEKEKEQEQQEQREQQEQEQLVDCLSQMPVDHLLSIDLPADMYRSVVGPVMNGAGFLAADARRFMMLQDSRAPWSRINVMLGFVSNEGRHKHRGRG